MSSVRNETQKGTKTAAERVDETRSANRHLLMVLSVLIALLVASAFVTRILYLRGH